MSHKVRRYLSYAILGGFIVCVTLVILAKILITPELVRDTVVPVVEKHLHCKVNLKKIDISLLSGVTLTNLELLSNDKHNMFLAADKVVMRYQLWPLIAQRIVIDEISLEKPRLNVAVLSDGRLNLQQLFDSDNKHSSIADSELNSDQSINILISKLFISQGEMLIRDYRFSSIPHRYKINNIGLNVDNFSLQHDFDIKLWGKINGSPVDIDGTINLGQRSYDLQLNIADMEMVQFQPYYHNLLPGHLDGLRLDVDGRFWSDGIRFGSKANIALHKLDVTLKSIADYPVRIDELGADCDVTFDSAKDELSIGSLTLSSNDIAAHCSGVIKHLRTTPDIGITVAADKLQLRSVVAAVPKRLSSSVAGLSLAGAVDVKLELRGQSYEVSRLVKSGTISLDEVQASVADMRPAVSGVIELNAKELQSKQLTLVVGDNHMTLDLQSSNWQKKRPTIHLQVTADEFTSVGLFNQHDNIDGEVINNRAGYTNLTEPGPAKLPFDLSGDITISTADFAGFAFSDLRTHYAIQNSILYFDHLGGLFAKGALNADGHVDLTRQGFVYSGHIGLRQIDLATLMPQINSEYVDTLAGIMSGAFDYSGAGTRKLRIQQNLSGKGSFTVDDGKMQGNAILKQLAQLLDISELKVFSFAHGSGEFTLITGGHLQYKAQFAGSRAKLMPEGSYFIDGTIKSDLDVYLSPQIQANIAGNSKVVYYLHDEQGWGVIPLTVTGRVNAPTVAINMKKVGATALSRGADKIDARIKEKTGVDVAPGVQLLESTLQNVFGK